MRVWYDAKDLVVQATGISMDALHVLAGVILLLGASLVLRRTVADWRPWVVVLAFELLNEAGDLLVEQWPSAGMQYREGVKDVLLTMFLPTLILLSARVVPRLYNASDNPDDQAPGRAPPTPTAS